MKVAYLILAHHQPLHLTRLIDALSSENSYFFIHIDAKQKISPFRTAVLSYKNVFLLDHKYRVKVYWGGYSQVAATLNLLKSAVSHELNFNRYCLLSGSDFPIKKKSFIEKEFAREIEFISIKKKLDYNSSALNSERIKYFHFWDNKILNLRTSPSRGFSSKINQILKKIPRHRYTKLPFYKGSQWWSLTDRCIQYILRFIDDNQDYTLFHKYSGVPDEMFFHSILKSSPFAKNMSYDFERNIPLDRTPTEKMQELHYVSWKNKKPKILTKSDMNALMESPALFARKFDEKQSNDLLQDLELLLHET